MGLERCRTRESPGTVLLILVGGLTLATAAWGQALYDGEWAGTTGQGHEVLITVEQDEVTYFHFIGDLRCAVSGEIVYTGVSDFRDHPISPGGVFESLLEMNGNRPEPGATVPIAIHGLFDSAIAEGTIFQGGPYYLGDGTKTESCHLRTSWRASWIGPVEEKTPLADPKERSVEGTGVYDGEWVGEVEGGTETYFTVESDHISDGPTILATYYCPRSGVSDTLYQSHGPAWTEIDGNGHAKTSDNWSQSTGAEFHAEKFFIWRATFETPDTVSGTFTAGQARYTGRGLRTESCEANGLTWDATRVTPQSVPAVTAGAVLGET